LLKAFWADLKTFLGLTNTATSSCERNEAGFWVFFLRGPRPNLGGPYYTVVSYCMINTLCITILVASSAKKTDLFAQACILKKKWNLKILLKVMHATIKNYIFIKSVLKETRLKLIKTMYYLIYLLMKSLKIFVTFSVAPYAQVTRQLKICIWHSIVNIVSQIPILWSTANRSYDYKSTNISTCSLFLV